MNLEQLLEKAKGMELAKDFSYFDIYDSPTHELMEFGIYEGSEKLTGLTEKEFAVFSCQALMYDNGKEQIVFFIEGSPHEFSIHPLRPDVERTYLVKAYTGEEPTREEAAYVIKGSFRGDAFTPSKAVEADFGEPRKTGDLSLAAAGMLMEFLRRSKLFPQNKREEEIASGMWATKMEYLILDGSSLSKQIEKFDVYANLLGGSSV